MQRFAKLVRTLLFLQTGLALFVGYAYAAGLPMFSDGDAEARKATAFLWGFAVLLFSAALRLPDDPRWIYPVVATVAFNLADSAYELVAMGNRDFVPPLLLEAGLLLVYGPFALAVARGAVVRARAAGHGVAR